MNIGCAIDPYDRESSLYPMAYLDVLGTTQRIRDQAHADETLYTLHNLYALETSVARETFKEKVKICFRIFSRLR